MDKLRRVSLAKDSKLKMKKSRTKLSARYAPFLMISTIKFLGLFNVATRFVKHAFRSFASNEARI